MSTVSVDFPLGGLNTRASYQKQALGTTASAENVRATCTFERRHRGGSRPGLKKAYSGQLGGGAPVQFLVSVSLVDSRGTLSRKLLACSRGLMYHAVGTDMDPFGIGSLLTEADVAIITESGDDIWLGGMQMNPDLPALQAVERAQMVYIANYDPIEVAGDDGSLTSGTLTAPSIVDWTAHGISESSVCQVTRLTGGITTGTYRILSVGRNSITIDCPGGTGTCSYLVRKGPVSFDPTTGTTALLLPRVGMPPLGCPLVALYRDRLVFAGPDHIWYMSRQGDPTDWDYGADPTDPSLAVAGTLSTAGTPGTPIKAIIPYSDDYLILGCEDTLWILRGDPAYGGQLDVLSRGVGIVGPTAWCRLPDSSLVFLSRDGLYAIAPGSSTYPVPVSRECLPNSLLDVDADRSVVTMAYDSQHSGIHLAVTPSDGTTGEHWWIQWPTNKGGSEVPTFWPVVLQDRHQPTAMLAFSSEETKNCDVLLGAVDGCVRRYDDKATTDDGCAILSHVRYGPMRLSGDDFSIGLLSELVGTIEPAGDAVAWKLFIADTTEEAAKATLSQAGGTWNPGRNRSVHPKRSGGAAVLDIASTGRWAMESVTAVVLPRGKQRL